MRKHLKHFWPFVGFVLSYTLLFYFMGHFDALDNVSSQKVIYFGAEITRGDAYFITLSAIVFLIYLSVLFTYKIVESKVLTFKEFALFTGIATALLPISIWGLAWIQWFSIKRSGTLTLWQVGTLKIALQWRAFMPLHIGLMLFFIAFTVAVILYKIYCK